MTTRIAPARTISKPVAFTVMAIFTALGVLVLQVGTSWNSVSYAPALMIGLFVVAATLPLYLFTPKVKARTTATERFAVYPLAVGLLCMAGILACYVLAHLRTGDVYTYEAKVQTVRQFKAQGRGNGLGQCTYTAYWRDERSGEYVMACTSEGMREHVQQGKPATVSVKAAAHLGGLVTRILGADVRPE